MMHDSSSEITMVLGFLNDLGHGYRGLNLYNKCIPPLTIHIKIKFIRFAF